MTLTSLLAVASLVLVAGAACSPIKDSPPSKRGVLGEYQNPRSNETFGHNLNPGQSENPGR